MMNSNRTFAYCILLIGKELTDFRRLPDVEVNFGNETGSVNRKFLRYSRNKSGHRCEELRVSDGTAAAGANTERRAKVIFMFVMVLRCLNGSRGFVFVRIASVCAGNEYDCH